jgi:hypothetical protein
MAEEESMSAIKTRSMVGTKWICLAVAGLCLAASPNVFGQSNEEKEKARKAAEERRKTPQKSMQPERKSETPPAEHKSAPPSTTTPATSTAPVNRGEQNPPVRTPPTTVNTQQAPVRTPPSTVNTQQAPVRTPPSNVNTQQPPVRTPPTMNNQQQRQPQSGTIPGGRVQNLNPPGNVTNGNTVRNNNGRSDFHGANNTQVHYNSTGQPAVVRTRDMTIVHSPTGVRQVVVERPDRTVIVTNNAGHGFVAHPYVVNNVTYVQRTYYVGGAPFVRVYRPFVFGGITLNIYTPRRYYAPVFYSWAYNPWAGPVVYNWGWNGSPWVGFYGGWFTPYPSYANATFWLTDYLIATSLQDAYQDRMAAGGDMQPYGAAVTPLSPEVKQQVADEVRVQLNEERAEASNPNGPPPAPDFLTDNTSHVFVVSSSLFLMGNGNSECPVSEGDVLQLARPPLPGSAYADAVVLASKRGECRRGNTVSVGITDLADMQSQMRATLDRGLGELQKHQGGLPAPPPSAEGPAIEPDYAAAAPPPDSNVSNELNQQAQASKQAETDALAQAAQPAALSVSGGAGTVNISLGMSIDDVVAAMGKPQQIANLGSKQTYFYPNMKIIFVDGKVSDVQ